ncbi:MAG TPA: TIGR00159 family protein, partial [Firmicutes bacterium]|nr:TIGR00159 family protein [Bacillota bacterium]
MLFWLFDLSLPLFLSLFLFLCGFFVFYISNSTEGRSFTSNNYKGKSSIANLFQHKSKTRPETLFDRDAVYKKVETAVITLAKQKIGAIITFEKKDSLTDVMKSGTIINAPVSSELLQTIFYPGTRLHDGAVIIKNDMILAASVYFTPTTRPLTGKFGSRHRAAIGISEVCDAVTVVVSEETGRISIAYQ